MTPLSPAQQRVWFLDQLEGPSATYNVPLYIRLRGELNREALRLALTDVAHRHESLRTVYRTRGGVPYQHILSEDAVEMALPVTVVAEEELPGVTARLAAVPFDLAADVPLRADLLEVGPLERILLVVKHHIATDGTSNTPFFNDLATAYRARLEGGAPDWEPLPVQYADYTAWQRELLGDDTDPDSTAARQLAFWRTELTGLPEDVGLPTDRPRPAVASYRGATHTVHCPPEVHGALAALARESGTTLFMLAQAATAVLLSKWGAGHDVPIGSLVEGRPDEALEDLVGFFVNTLVLRTDTSGNPCFRELVDRVRTADLAAWDHQDLPFDRLVEELNPQRSAGRHPLFQVLVAVEDVPRAPDLPGLTASIEPADGSTAKFDLTFMFTGHHDEAGAPSGLEISVQYAADLYDPDTIRAAADQLVRLLAQAAADPDRPIGSIEILAPEERRRILTEWNATDREVPPETLPDLFRRRAAATPHAPALVTAAGTLTYGELNARANRLAHHLIGLGVGPESRVALALPRSEDLITAMLAVLKVGGAYLPVDPRYPAQRIEYVLDDASPACLITTEQVAAGLGAAAVPPLPLDHEGVRQAVAACPDTDPEAHDLLGPLTPASPAYVIYTSGSTGRPKGVVVAHTSLVNFLAAMEECAGLTAADRLLAVTTIAFDIAGLEIFLPLTRGAAVVLADEETVRDPRALAELAASSGATLLQATPSLWQELLAVGSDTVRGLRKLVGGEALPAALAALMDGQGAPAANMYGPTETTIWSTSAPLAGASPASIGRPVANTRVYVLDESARPVPVGASGELYIAGAGLARGYLNRPALTAERFVADPYGPPGSRMYRTGDLVRWNRDGELLFLGRTDQQVKIRGFRIELGEVEAGLAAHPSVAQVAVTVREDRPGDQRLVGYVVPEPDATSDELATEVRDFVQRRLPDHMVPSAVVVLAELPLTPNGKLDRRALPAPAHTDRAAGRAPRTPEEQVLCTLFAEVLGVERVGVDDNFFDLGGHSILATRLAGRVRAVLDTELAIRTLFDAPTVAALATRLDGGRQDRLPLRPAARPDRVPMSFEQRRLWFLSELDGGVPYNIPFALRLTGAVDTGALSEALADVVDRHEVLRTVFPAADGEQWQEVLSGPDARPVLRTVRTDEDRLAGELAAAAEQPFRLTHEFPLRAWLFELGPEDHVLLLVVHHIACDGWSLEPMLRDLAEAYGARRAGGAPDWPALRVQYADYTLWQRELLGSADDPESLAARQLAYWRGALAGVPDQLRLPFDRPRTQEAGLRAGLAQFTVGAGLHEGLAAVARASGSTLFMALQAAVAVVLSRLGAGTDIPLGTATSGRSDEALDGMVGFFVNTLVLRTDVSGNPAFAELLSRVRETDLAAFAHQDVPFESLVEALNPVRVPGANPLFQVSVSMQIGDEAALDLPGLGADWQEVGPGLAAFDLSFVFNEVTREDTGAAALDASIRYRADLFDHSSVEAFAGWLVRLLEAVVADPGARIAEIDLLSAEERLQVLTGWNDTAREVPARTLPELFADRLARGPQAPAVVFRDVELTYSDLDAESSRLAHELIARGIGPERIVALALPRSEQLVVAHLAVLKAGAAYLPVDPDYPAERIAFMLEDAAPACVLTTGAVAAALPVNAGVPALALDDETLLRSLERRPATAPSDAQRIAALRPAHPAYVIYTSGSTGRPKGVVVSHAGVPDIIGTQALDLGVEPGSRVLQFASASFDASVSEMWMALLSGACLVIASEADRTAGAGLVEFLRANRITHATLPPAVLLGTEFDGDVAGVTLVTAGEACTPAVADAVRHFGRAVNAYGPTEATVCATMHRLEPAETFVPIGRPLANTQVYVLDELLAPVPAGAPGELYIAGAGLARGYLNRPALTAERFVANPYGAPGTRMYRTGDVGAWTKDGELMFLGRADQQVKIRGFRIEPGEVESAVLTHPGVARAAVIAREDRPGDVRLVAYVVPAEPGKAPEPAEIRGLVAERLPEYMVPSAVTVLDALPLTPNGKLDPKSLPVPGAAPPAAGAAPRRPADPRTDVLSRLFGRILGLDHAVGQDESFFELGGHSLLAVRLIARIRALLGTEITIRTLFEAPTPAALAMRLDEAPSDQFSHVIELRRDTRSGRPVFAIHPIGGLAWCYSALLPYVDQGQAVYGIQVTESHGRFRTVASMEELVGRYTDLIRSTHPEGPYVIVGWSLGGVLAYEVASRIEAEGGKVDLIAMFDSRPYDTDVTGDASDEGFVHWVSTEVLGSGSEDSVIDGRQNKTLIRAARAIAAVLGPSTTDGYQGRAVNIAASRTVVERGPADVPWKPYLGDAEHHVVEAEHSSMMTRPVMEQAGPILRAALAELPALTPGASGTDETKETA